MESTLLQALVQVESNTLPQAPKKAVSRTYPAVPQRDDGLQLDISTRTLERPGSSGASSPRDERDLEMSPVGPSGVSGVSGVSLNHAKPSNAVEVLPSLTDPPMNKFRFIACCSQNLGGGLTDSASGTLIPYIEKHYNIGYAMVSLIFIGYALGFVAAAPLVDVIRVRLGRAKMLAMATLFIATGNLPLILKAPFPAIVAGYFVIGFGFALTLAIGNVFTANLQNGTILLGAMHGSYGIGGTAGPLIATSIVSTVGGSAWNRYYILTLAMVLFNASLYLWSFWNYEKEMDSSVDTATLSSTRGATSALWAELATMSRAFKSRIVLLSATFIFAYQGAEVSISGWVISFLIAARGSRPSAVGSVTSGFWGGITLGRFALSPIGARVGEKRFIYVLTTGAAIFQLLVWLLPNIIGEVVSLAVVGLLLGPVYPCAATVFTRNLSRREQVSGLGVISAFGSSGGAVAPFITGLLAQAVGTFVLHPIAIGLFGAMLVCWFVLPTARKRTE
ncbi:MFS general substrate transporter [Xylaria sp. CBS 124048]|nr:MFS general substrate transporter [Xylaria sp. CBS 124048]